MINVVNSMIKIKRIYNKPEKEEGYRIFVDRLWSRGLSKNKVRIDLWLKEIAPSDTLRKWFSHDPGKWGQFKEKYLSELKQKKELVNKIRQLEKQKRTITLLFSAKDEERNNAVVLRECLKK